MAESSCNSPRERAPAPLSMTHHHRGCAQKSRLFGAAKGPSNPRNTTIDFSHRLLEIEIDCVWASSADVATGTTQLSFIMRCSVTAMPAPRGLAVSCLHSLIPSVFCAAHITASGGWGTGRGIGYRQDQKGGCSHHSVLQLASQLSLQQQCQRELKTVLLALPNSSHVLTHRHRGPDPGMRPESFTLGCFFRPSAPPFRESSPPALHFPDALPVESAPVPVARTKSGVN